MAAETTVAVLAEGEYGAWNRMVAESPDGTLTFADADGRLKTVSSSEIEERKPQPTSIMPDNLAQSLTLQEFRDLTAFLLSSHKR